MDDLPTPVVIFIVLVLSVALVALTVSFFNDHSVKNDYVVIFYEGIHICGYVEKAKLRDDVWEITLRGGAKYKAPREIVIFCPDPFTSQNVSSQEGNND